MSHDECRGVVGTGRILDMPYLSFERKMFVDSEAGSVKWDEGGRAWVRRNATLIFLSPFKACTSLSARQSLTSPESPSIILRTYCF